ncbi:hypothetical protein L218DRAFT_949884 [Marasmius fiardii PR-910]|nr:hypothetical protein L218DRAFT_949884 [Marasmius fiardii PR-910]
MADQARYAPRADVWLGLLDIFGLNTTTSKICATFITLSIAGCFIIHFRYPCRSTASLLQIVDQAKAIFYECSTNRWTVVHGKLATEHVPTLVNLAPCILREIYRDYLERASFCWKRLRDIVKCHRETQTLTHNLKMCLSRASHSRAEHELQTRLTRSNNEGVHFPQHNVDLTFPYSHFPALNSAFNSYSGAPSFISDVICFSVLS